jgi:hypothetical protein
MYFYGKTLNQKLLSGEGGFSTAFVVHKILLKTKVMIIVSV